MSAKRTTPIDCDENTSQEERKVRKKATIALAIVSPPVSNPTSVGLDADALLKELGLLDDPNEEAATTVAATPPITDGFTCFVQHTTMNYIYRGNIPQDEPNKAKDGEALFQDKVAYHRYAFHGGEFWNKELHPSIVRIVSVAQQQIAAASDVQQQQFFTAMLDMQELNTSEDNQVLTLGTDGPHLRTQHVDAFKSIHNLHHLRAYIGAVVRESIKGKQYDDKALVDMWPFLTGPTFSKLPISEWHELTGLFFVDCIGDLYRTWQYAKKSLLS